MTFVKQLLTCQGPVVGIKMMLSSRSKPVSDFANGAALVRGKGKRDDRNRTKGDKDEAFIDIIARGGQEWIRMYRYVPLSSRKNEI